MARGALLVALLLLLAAGCAAPGADELGRVSCDDGTCSDAGEAPAERDEEPEREPEPEPEPERDEEPQPEPEPEREPEREPEPAPQDEGSAEPEAAEAEPAEDPPAPEAAPPAEDDVAAEGGEVASGEGDVPTEAPSEEDEGEADPASDATGTDAEPEDAATEGDPLAVPPAEDASEEEPATQVDPTPAPEGEATDAPATEEPDADPEPSLEEESAEVELEEEAPPPTGTVIFTGNATSGGGGSAVESPTRAAEAPDVVGFALSETLANNSGLAEIIVSGRIADADGEDSIRAIEVRGGGVPGAEVLGVNHTIRAAERAEQEEPTTWSADGFRVWDETPGDGVLHFAYRLTIPHGQQAGLYVLRAIATDDTEAAGFSSGVTLEVIDYARVQVQSAPVDLEGRSLPGQGWGGWAAAPGARNVTATNYLKIVNAGTLDAVTVRLAFTRAFAGEADARYKIPIANNLELAWWEDTTPSSTRPSEGQFNYIAARDDGFADISFTGAGNVVYVSYRFKQLPAVLAIQEYSAPFTLSEGAPP